MIDHPKCEETLQTILRRPSKLVQLLVRSIYLAKIFLLVGSSPDPLRILCARGYHRTPVMVGIVTAWLLATQLQSVECSCVQECNFLSSVLREAKYSR